ncbi:MAG: phage portal protein [Kouleothrix sp.]|nr:phage portal protein [Kouleothrix sp.]
MAPSRSRPRFFARLRYGIARMLLKAQSFSIVPSWFTQSVLQPAFRSLVRDGYQKSSAFFACISTLAFSFPEPPLYVYDAEGEEGQSMPMHGLRKLLRKPMPTMGEAEFKATVIVYLALGGNAYLHKLRNKAGQVIQLRPYHAGHITCVPGGENWISHYLYNPNGTGTVGVILDDLTRIEPNDIVHLKWPSVDPAQPWQSQPPILAAAAEVDSDVEAIRYIFALLKNDAIPRTVVTVPAERPLDDEEVRRMKEQWRERYGGDNRGEVAILEAGATVTRLGLNLQELAFDALVRIPETRIAAVLRVPPILVGLNSGLDKATYANYAEARRAFTQDTLVPLWRLFESEIEADLLPEFPRDGGMSVRHDLSRVASLQDDINGKWERVRKAYLAGLIKKNEGRRSIGYAAELDGDVYYTPPTAQVVQPAKRTLPSATPKALLMLPDGQIVNLDDDDGGEEHAYFRGGLRPAPGPRNAPRWRPREQNTADLEPIEAKIERAMQRYLRAEYRKAAEGVRDAAKAGELDPAVIDQLGLDLGPEVRRIMHRFYPQVMKPAFEDAEIALDVTIGFDVESKEVQQVLSDLADLVTRITETTRNDIRALIGMQAAEGWSIEQLAKELMKAGVTASTVRATMIARTETAAAYSRGSLLAYELSGVVDSVEWMATIDDLTCEDCKALNGTITKLGKAFSDGTQFPPRHPNCRCTLIPLLKK